MFRDISTKIFGRYQHCTEYDGVMYADCDFTKGHGCGKPVKGAIPAPGQEETRPFGSYSGPSRKRREKTPEERKTERQQAHDLLERLAREGEPEALTKSAAIFAEAQAEHARDVAGFRFECRRWGTFMSLSAARMANPAEPNNRLFYIERPERSYSTSLNLLNVTAIRLIRGHLPDKEGQLRYAYNLKADDEKVGTHVGGTGFGNYLPSTGYRWVVFPRLPEVPYSRPLFHLPPAKQKRDKDGIVIWDSETYEIQHATEGFARPAEDDVILFEGIEARLFVPAGEGERVYESILRANDATESSGGRECAHEPSVS
jgi:hypothetical protein